MQIEMVTAWVMLAALAGYTLLGGADLGAGVWDALARGPRKQLQRDLLANAIGPIWEANHVWLILVVVLLFTCFPPAFAGVMTALHVPITLMLLGIVARGASFVFRSYSAGGERQRWGQVFSVASVVTPVLLGVVLGTIASGGLRWEGDLYVSGWFAPWLQPFPWVVGLFVLSVFAFLAATYMCVEAARTEAGDDFRRRALWSGAAVAVLAIVTWWGARAGAEALGRGLSERPWVWAIQAGGAVAGAGAMLSLWRRRYVLARACAGAEVGLIVLGYGGAMFPYLVAPHFTIGNSGAPALTHRLVLGALALGALVLGPSLFVLFRVFKGSKALAASGERIGGAESAARHSR